MYSRKPRAYQSLTLTAWCSSPYKWSICIASCSIGITVCKANMWISTLSACFQHAPMGIGAWQVENCSREEGMIEIVVSRRGGLLATLAGALALKSTAAALGGRVPSRAPSLPCCWSIQHCLHVTLQPPQCRWVLQFAHIFISHLQSKSNCPIAIEMPLQSNAFHLT